MRRFAARQNSVSKSLAICGRFRIPFLIFVLLLLGKIGAHVLLFSVMGGSNEIVFTHERELCEQACNADGKGRDLYQHVENKYYDHKNIRSQLKTTRYFFK